MGLFRLFATFGVFVVFTLVILSTATVGFLTPDPAGTVWFAMSGFVALLTAIMALGFYQTRLIYA